MTNTTKALVVLSGGQDSTTCLYWAKARHAEVHAVTFDYGQRHRIEIEAARTVAAMAKVASHEIIALHDLLRSATPLTDPSVPLETYADHDSMAAIIGNRIEKTFVPLRNLLFLVVAANRAVALGCDVLVTGVCEADNANYPDCRRVFVDATAGALNLALGKDRGDAGPSLVVATPLMSLSKAQTVHLATTLPGCMEALAYSHTAYDGRYPPTGADHASVLRAHGFEQAGVPDPLVVRAWRDGLMPLPASANYDTLRAPATV